MKPSGLEKARGVHAHAHAPPASLARCFVRRITTRLYFAARDWTSLGVCAGARRAQNQPHCRN